MSSNQPEGIETLEQGCLDHLRRQFFEIQDFFPSPCQYVLEELKGIYGTDRLAREQKLDSYQRLALHQEKSAPVMEQLQSWCQAQIEGKHVEPNSALGKAIRYFLNHSPALTLFLREPGVPLSNAECERSIKKKILIRKNSYFYRTLKGAEVGDGLVSLIATCAEAAESAYEYFVALLKNSQDVELHPSDWLPWNFRLRLALLTERP